MSVFRINKKCNCQQILRSESLRAKWMKCQAGKGASFFPSRHCKPHLMASMAVEAAIAVPLFLFFLFNILFSFEMLRLNGSLMSALHQIGNEMIFNGYAYQKVTQGHLPNGFITSGLLSQGYVKPQIIQILGADYLNNSCLESGAAGLNLSKSSVMRENDIVELIVSYRVKPFVKVLGFPVFSMETRYYGRAWTGYDVENRGQTGLEEQIVFVTATGSVYHLARSCTYLNPSISIISFAAIEEARNKNGGKFYKCENCSGGIYQAVVYVTEYGDRYHGSLSCKGLKRTVYAIPISKTGGKSCCTKCSLY